jgi:hypothetical protein
VEAELKETPIEPPDDVEDESYQRRAPRDVEILVELFVATVVLNDREIALAEGAKLLVGVECASRTILEELGLDGEPQNVDSDAALRHRVSEVVRDGAEDPGMDDDIHLHLVWRGKNDVIREDVAL